jgi:hypothetical protein
MPSESTLKQYAMRMAILAKAGVDIRTPTDVFTWLESNGHGLSSQKLYIASIQNTLGTTSPPAYREKIKDIFKVLKEKESKQLLTDKQQSNFVKWTDLLAAQTKLAGMQKSDVQWKQYVVVSLYTLNAPVRADYGAMEVHTRRNKSRTENELIWNSKPTFIFRKYKTAGGYGVVEIPVSKPLVAVLKEWFEHLGSVPKYLLGETATSSNTFAVYIAETFKKHTGKSLGVSLIRHSYITHVYPTLRSLAKKEELARRMLHSTERQERYISLKDMD